MITAQRRFRRTVLFTALAGHLAYSLAAEKPGLALIGIFATALSAWLVRQAMAGTPRPLPRPLLNGLVITAILHLIWQLISHRQEPITSLTDFLAYVMLVKSLDRVRMRDEAQLLGLSLFVVIGALLTGQSLAMGLALVIYTLLAISATVSLQLFSSIERQHDLLKAVGLADQGAALDAQMTRQRASRATAIIAATCVVASMVSGVVAFVITPRQLAQQLGLGAARAIGGPSTDFSDTMQLGNSGTINQDNTPVMDVRALDEAGAATGPRGLIYLRGAALTHYADGSWTSGGGSRAGAADGNGDAGNARSGAGTPGDATPVPPREKREPEKTTLGKSRIDGASELNIIDARAARSRSSYEIIQRNTRPVQDIPLFVPLQPVTVRTESPGTIAYRYSDAMVHLSQGGGRIAYTVTSIADYRDPDNLQLGADYTPTDKIKQLAATIREARSLDAAPYTAGPVEVRRTAQAIVLHLGTFEYTLEMEAPRNGQDPIEMFLFETKRGHCEYFAAAMVALLKASDIPARIATGYVAAEYNGVSGYYTVRKSDAHAWVEVQMEPGRWETFDPTPPGELQSTRRASGGPLAWMKHLWDAIEFSWLDNVVAYDKGIKLDVIGLAGRADPGAAAVKWQERLRAMQTWMRRHLPEGVLTRSLLVGLATFVLVMGGYWVFRVGGKVFAPVRAWLQRFLPGRRRAAGEGIPVPADAAFYREALNALAAAGVAKPTPTPPLAFADTLSEQAAPQMRRLTDLYYLSRFGGAPLSAQQQAEGQTALDNLRSALAPAARPKT